jgi:hypothetical protein
MIKVKTKAAFETKAHRVISRGPGEVINMPEADFKEVEDKVEVLDKPSGKVRISKYDKGVNDDE